MRFVSVWSWVRSPLGACHVNQAQKSVNSGWIAARRHWLHKCHFPCKGQRGLGNVQLPFENATGWAAAVAWHAHLQQYLEKQWQGLSEQNPTRQPLLAYLANTHDAAANEAFTMRHPKAFASGRLGPCAHVTWISLTSGMVGILHCSTN
jgi:hypothetical protein